MKSKKSDRVKERIECLKRLIKQSEIELKKELEKEGKQ